MHLVSGKFARGSGCVMACSVYEAVIYTAHASDQELPNVLWTGTDGALTVKAMGGGGSPLPPQSRHPTTIFLQIPGDGGHLCGCQVAPQTGRQVHAPQMAGPCPFHRGRHSCTARHSHQLLAPVHIHQPHSSARRCGHCQLPGNSGCKLSTTQVTRTPLPVYSALHTSWRRAGRLRRDLSQCPSSTSSCGWQLPRAQAGCCSTPAWA